MERKKELPSELLLALAMLINSFNLVLMVKSELGVSTLSSLPLVLASILSRLSLGNWTILIQVVYILLLVIYTKRLKMGYILSFIVSIIFGMGVDFFTNLTIAWPLGLGWRCIYFVVGMLGMGFGAALFMICRLPILPFDLIVRELSEYMGVSVKSVKFSLDAISVILSTILSWLFLGEIVGVGIGTIMSVLLMGNIIQYSLHLITDNFSIRPFTEIGRIMRRVS